jgi:hypothetical protein
MKNTPTFAALVKQLTKYLSGAGISASAVGDGFSFKGVKWNETDLGYLPAELWPQALLGYPPFMQEFFDNWDAQKIVHSVAEAALGRPAPGSWVWLTRVTAQSRAERSLVGHDSGVWAWTSSDAAKNADGMTGGVRDKSAKGEATEAAPSMRGEQQGEPRSVKKDEPRGELQQREQIAKKGEQQGEAKFREGR